ncbi:MAG: pilus assembly protein [Thermodesulfobacteriota bacterium]
MQEFTSGNISKEDLGVENDASRDTIIKYVRGNNEDFQDTWDIDKDNNYTEPRPYKLGDIFHSNPVIVGSPPRFFKDEGYSGPGGFYEFNKKRTKIVIVGANDGMLHAFNAGDWNDSLNEGLGSHNAGSGKEEWAFIPPSILKKLQSMTSQHTYYVDSSPKVADVWFYSSPSDNTKSKDEWKTVLVCGLRKGGKHYFALDITDTKNPKFLWEFPSPNDNSTLEKLGESWSEPFIGKVKLGGFERWVAIIGGGFDPDENRKNATSQATIGKGLFVVDIKSGEIIKEISGLNGMNYSFPSPPTAVDINLDGYLDKVYIGDLGGQMWVFDISSDNKEEWTGKRLFVAPATTAEKHPIYYQPAVAFDPNKIPWVFFGTGDRENPKDSTNPPERFYGVKDDGQGSYPRREENLKDLIGLGQNTFTKVTDPYKGWFIKLEKTEGKHEKVLAKPSVFNRMVYFTTYSYKQTNDPCQVKGDAKIYIVEYLSGGGALLVDDYTDLLGPTSDRSRVIGEGIPSPPVISINTEGEASAIVVTTDGQIFRRKAFSPLKKQNLLYWREVVR